MSKTLIIILFIVAIILWSIVFKLRKDKKKEDTIRFYVAANKAKDLSDDELNAQLRISRENYLDTPKSKALEREKQTRDYFNNLLASGVPMNIAKAARARVSIFPFHDRNMLEKQAKHQQRKNIGRTLVKENPAFKARIAAAEASSSNNSDDDNAGLIKLAKIVAVIVGSLILSMIIFS